MVSMDDLAAFEQEVNAAKVRYHVDIFDAKHGLHQPASHPQRREKRMWISAYNEKAAAQSWQNMLNLLERVGCKLLIFNK